MIMKGDATSGAVFSDCGGYRYRLWRYPENQPFGPAVLWIMLNPSTADETKLDPTVTRCRNYAKQWGYDCFEVCNLFALRSTDRGELKKCSDPAGTGNDVQIMEAAKSVQAGGGIVMCGWGNDGGYQGRSKAVRRMLEERGIRLYYLKLNGTGEPVHPLYQRADLTPVLFSL